MPAASWYLLWIWAFGFCPSQQNLTLGNYSNSINFWFILLTPWKRLDRF
jgi:hypothetical protein